MFISILVLISFDYNTYSIYFLYSLQNRNLVAVLNSTKNGQKVATKLLKGENLEVKEMNEFNRIVVQDLVNICG